MKIATGLKEIWKADQRRWAAEHGCVHGTKGYVDSLSFNLFQPMSPNTEADFSRGSCPGRRRTLMLRCGSHQVTCGASNRSSRNLSVRRSVVLRSKDKYSPAGRPVWNGRCLIRCGALSNCSSKRGTRLSAPRRSPIAEARSRTSDQPPGSFYPRIPLRRSGSAGGEATSQRDRRVRSGHPRGLPIRASVVHKVLEKTARPLKWRT